MLIDDHRINCFSGFGRVSRPVCHTGFADLAVSAEQISIADEAEDFDRGRARPVNCWLPEALRPAALGKYQNKPLFEETTVREISTDLHIPVRELLGGGDKSRCVRFKLTDAAKKFLKTGELYEENTALRNRYSHQLCLALPKSAMTRLCAAGIGDHEAFLHNDDGALLLNAAKAPVVPAEVDDVSVFAFSTGRVLSQTTLRIKTGKRAAIPGDVLTEIVDHCGHLARLCWLQAPNRKAAQTEPGLGTGLLEFSDFTLGGLIARLIFGAAAAKQTSHRIFTHSYARVASDEQGGTRDGAAKLGVLLSRQYNSDYDIEGDPKGTRTLSDFRNVVHCISREGASTVVMPRTDDRDIPFLKTYYTSALVPRYLPILQLNLHQLHESLEINAKAALPAKDDRDDDQALGEDTVRWQSLRDDLTILNTEFRFQQVSSVTMHNAYNDAFRDCFALGKFEAGLRKDLENRLALAEASLGARKEHRRQNLRRTFLPLTLLGAGALSGVVAMEFVNTWHTLSTDGWTLVEALFGCTAIACAVGGAWYARKRLKDDF